MSRQFIQDLRIGFRSLAQNPAFTVAALMSFSLGIAAATAMFSVIDGVIIHPFIYAHPETLMSIYWWENDRNRSDRPYTPEAYLDIAERSNIFEGVIASTISDVLLTGTSNPERLRGNFVTRTCSRFLECSPG